MDDEQVEQILDLVAKRRGIDFRDYRRETLERRAVARARAIGCADLAAYRRRIDQDAGELDRLVEALVVPVSGFFRDAWAFRELSDRVLPALAIRRPLLRAWVAGAATGEEAYTLAMLLAELSARHAGGGFEVIASDIDRPSLEVARAAVYPDKAAGSIPADLRARYLRADGSQVRVAEAIRGRVRFAEHDLMGARLAPREAVVAAFDIVLCRNVLLYFDRPLRAKAVSKLAAVVEPAGALMIGAFETLPQDAERVFQPFPGVSAGAGIFVRSAA
jgi:chemotaxis methyl-accepting protein methylase